MSPDPEHSSGSGAARPERGERAALALLAILRVYLGLVFLIAVWPKLGPAPGFAPRLRGFLQGLALEHAHPFYRPFLARVVTPHARLFASLVVAGESVAALSLVTGTATRLGAGIAMILLLNYMLAKGMWLWTPASNDAALFLIAAAVGAGAAGRVAGFDAFLAREWPRVPLW